MSSTTTCVEKCVHSAYQSCRVNKEPGRVIDKKGRIFNHSCNTFNQKSGESDQSGCGDIDLRSANDHCCCGSDHCN